MSSCCKENVLCCSAKRIEKDVFERCYTFTNLVATDEFTLWEADGIVNTCGTLILEVITIDPDGATISVFLNDSATPEVTGLSEGDSFIITSDPLNKIELTASLANTTFKVNLCLTINYECC